MRHSGKSSFKADDARLMGGNEIGAVSTGVNRFKVGATARGGERQLHAQIMCRFI